MERPTSPLTPERGLRALAAVALLLSACDVTPGKTGVPGETGLALFSAETTLVFEYPLLVGSGFSLSALARRPDDEKDVLGATFVSTDEGVLAVADTELEEPEDEDGFARVSTEVQLVGSGEAYLEIRKGTEMLDRVLFKAAEAGSADLLDTKILGSSVDARLPEHFGLVDRGPLRLALAASDRCGGPLLALGGGGLFAAEPGSSEEEDPLPSSWVTVAPGEAGSFELSGALDNDNPLVPRRAELFLDVPGLAEARRFQVRVVPAASVDDVRAEVASAEPGRAEIWGRAFADDIEVIGLDFNWNASPRVTLNRREGPNVLANVFFPEQGEPEDERPATVTAKVFGEEGTKDLFTLMSESDLVTRRVPAPAAEAPAPAGPSCAGEGKGACDPYGAGLAGLFLFTLRLSRRRRSP